MFEFDMNTLRNGLVSSCMFAYTSIWAQDYAPIDFVPQFKKGERMVYQLVETKFRQNPNGHYVELMYDTSYMMFNVTEKNDSQTMVDFRYADAIINEQPYVEPLPKNIPNKLKTETYKLVLDNKGEFIELSNWESFRTILVDNLKLSYLTRHLDSNSLKYYYMFYQQQDNVEKTVIPRVLELFDIFGKTYQLENTYSLAREIVNPFGGQNLLKSCPFRPFLDSRFPNSVFFAGQIKTNSVDNECLQEDYYAWLNEKRPDANSEIVPPYILVQDTYNYQWGLLSKRIISYSTTHTVWLGQDKQGLDRVYRFYAY